MSESPKKLEQLKLQNLKSNLKSIAEGQSPNQKESPSNKSPNGKNGTVGAADSLNLIKKDFEDGDGY